MGQAKQKKDRMTPHIEAIMRKRAEIVDKFAEAYIAACMPEHKEEIMRNPAAWIRENVEMVDQVEKTGDGLNLHQGATHVVFFRKRTPRPDELKELLDEMWELFKGSLEDYPNPPQDEKLKKLFARWGYVR